MNKKIRKITRWLAIMMVFFLLFPAGSLAEESVNPGDQSVAITTPDNRSILLKGESEPASEIATEIETLEQVPELSSNKNVNQQIVVVYADSGEDNV